MKFDKPSISFGGGGLRSMSHSTGVITGLLESDIPLLDFLDKFDIVSGNSGGSWFMSLMMYSAGFHEMLNSRNIEKPSSDITNGHKWWRRLYDYACGCCRSDADCRVYEAQSDNSYNGYLGRLFATERLHAKTSNSFVKWLFSQKFATSMLEFFGPLIYYVGMSWNSTVTELIFNSSLPLNHPKSFNHNLSDVCNDEINNHCVWAVSLLTDCSLTTTLSVAIEHPLNQGVVGENHGVSIPIFFDYNHYTQLSDMRLYEGQINTDTTGETHIYASYYNQLNSSDISKNDFKYLLSMHARSEVMVSDVSSISGAAMSILASNDILKNIIERSIEEPYMCCKFNLGYIKQTISCACYGLADLITNIFEEMAIPVALESTEGFKILGGVYEGGWDVGSDNGTHKITTDDSLVKEKVIRLGDGGYVDNTSIAYALKTFQKKNNKRRIFHHVNITSLTYDDDKDENSQNHTSDEINNLFGTMEEVDKKIMDVGFEGCCVNVKQPIIFLNEEKQINNDGMILWWGYIGKVSVNIKFFRTETVSNSSFGILEDWDVQLFVISVRSDDKVFMFPGSDSKDQEHYVDTTKKVNRLMVIAQDEFPSLFDIMFTNPNNLDYDDDLHGNILFLNHPTHQFPTHPTRYEM
jgi:hypothetical protein